jgi:hypothetical protein
MLGFLLQRFRPELTAYPIAHNVVTLPSMEALWESVGRSCPYAGRYPSAT